MWLLPSTRAHFSIGMTSSSVEHEQTGCRQPKTSTHLEIHTDSETLLNAINVGSFDTRTRDTGRTLSLRITDLVNEAFPMPVSIDYIPGQLSSGDSDSMNEVTARSDGPLPPVYIPLQQPPRYNRSGSLVSQDDICVCHLQKTYTDFPLNSRQTNFQTRSRCG